MTSPAPADSSAPDPVAPRFAPIGLLGDLASPLHRLLGGRPPQRPVGRPGRTHVAVRGLTDPAREDAGRLLEKEIAALHGVSGAVVNAPLARVVVDHGPETSVAELVRTVAAFERAHGLEDEELPESGALHPGDATALTRHVVALATDLAGFGLMVGERLLGPVGPAIALPPALTATLSLADSVPSLRALAERVAGASATESWFSLSSAFVQAVGRGPLGLVADACYRASRAAEAHARLRSWDRWDRTAELGAHAAAPCSVDDRPAPLRSGPVERVGDTVGAVSLAGLGVAAWLMPERAVAVLLAGVPKSARWGREAFAAAAGRELATHDTVLVDPSALRRADRLDVVVLDADLPGAAAGALHAAAARVGRVVVTDTDRPAAVGLVHEAQRDGAGVAVVAARGAEALAAADLAVGVGADAPWTADLRCPGVAGARAVLAVARVAPGAAQTAAALALLASASAVPLAVASRLPGLAGRVSLPVTTGALLAVGLGTAAGTAAARAADPD